MHTRKLLTNFYRILDLLFIAILIFQAPAGALAAVWTDPVDYPPGSTVTIRGDNSDVDTANNWLPGESVHVDVAGPNSYSAFCEGVADGAGAWTCEVTLLSDPTLAVGEYLYTATGLSSGNVEHGMFTDGPPSVENLWQCDPPDVFDPNTYTCVSSSATGWVTGNDDGPFFEGDTVPYRTRMSNLLTTNQYSITIQWDTTKSSKHAIDYLKTFNATITAADPCASLTGLPAGLCSTSTTYPIPADTFMQSDPDWMANGGVQEPGVFTMFGGTITSVSAYTTPSSYVDDTSTSITIFFTASSTDIVLAWGGHIASRADWGPDSSAVSISGSPYHMRILSWFDVTANSTLNVGNTDRSLSAQAVIYPASITIIKQATPVGSTSFPFTASPSPLANFSLVDDGTSANTKVFSDIKDFQTYLVTENTPAGWTLAPIVCVVTSPNGGSQSVSGATATINLKEGENVTCTYSNTHDLGSLKITKTVLNPDGATLPATFAVNYNCGVGYTGQVSVAYPTPGFVTVPNIPTGSTCSVTEVAPTPITAFAWGAITYTPASIVISTKGGTFEIVVGNSIKQMYLAYTPGFWKNHGPDASSGHNAWQYTAYNTTDLLGGVFTLGPITACTPKGRNSTPYDQMTLLQALSLRGGKDLCGSVEILLRAGTAALLNASINERLATHDGFGFYPLTSLQVISMVNDALASDDRTQILELASLLDGYNNGGSEYFNWTWTVP